MLPQAEDSWTVFEAAHLLNRAGFGGSPDEIRAFHQLGRFEAVDSLVSPVEAMDAFPRPDWANPAQALADMQARDKQRRETMLATRDLPPAEADRIRRESNQQFQKENRRRALEGQGWWFRRMLHSAAPLREKMTLFWHDHFATSFQKVKQPVLLIRQNELFRRHALGSFKDLTHAILMDPAMMIYLDLQSSRKGQANENFAREVLELFTLGEGHYTEQDIRDAARAFTGYHINRRNGKVVHNRRQWDNGDKTFFGKTGPFNGTDIINLIFERQEVSRFMSRKIWEFFVYENPSESAVSSLATSFRQHGYQTGPLLREMFLSKEFYTEASIRSQIQCPVQYIVQLLKQLEIPEPPVGFPITAQQQLGQTLFMPPNVAGWDWGKAWINTNTLLTRYNLAGFLTKGAVTESSSAMAHEGMRVPKRNRRGWQGPDYDKIAPRFPALHCSGRLRNMDSAYVYRAHVRPASRRRPRSGHATGDGKR